MFFSMLGHPLSSIQSVQFFDVFIELLFSLLFVYKVEKYIKVTLEIFDAYFGNNLDKKVKICDTTIYCVLNYKLG